jgi:hypothetical protein
VRSRAAANNRGAVVAGKTRFDSKVFLAAVDGEGVQLLIQRME